MNYFSGEIRWLLNVLAISLCASGCQGDNRPAANTVYSDPASKAQQQAWCSADTAEAAAQPMAYKLVARYPHRSDAFTQGLLFRDGYIYESTGLYGKSTLARYRPGEQQAQLLASLPDDRFGEGLEEVDGIYYWLTWKSGEVLRFALPAGDAGSADQAAQQKAPKLQKLQKLPSLQISGEGWGLASDGDNFWSSDGSSTLTLRDKSGLELLRKLEVSVRGRPARRLNELEWVRGCIVANIWGSDLLVAIDPQSGAVSHTISLEAIARRERQQGGGVTNGIALRSDNGNWIVTGKNWRHLYEIAPQIPPL